MKTIVYDRAGRPVDFDLACMMMDDELREEVFMHCIYDLQKCQDVYDDYCDLHLLKYGCDFVLWGDEQ